MMKKGILAVLCLMLCTGGGIHISAEETDGEEEPEETEILEAAEITEETVPAEATEPEPVQEEEEEAVSAAEGGNDASSHFHAVITTSKDTYTSGETAVISVRYNVDQGSISPGDYVIIYIPEDIVEDASFTVSSQHFTSVEKLGGGMYKLTFGEDAGTALTGSMTIRAKTNADTETTDTITAGDGSKTITVIPAGSGGGSGTYEDEALMKDGLGNDGMSYGGYDYTSGDPVQVGVFDGSVDHDFVYRLYVNRKNVNMTGVTVTDTLPDGMYLAGGVSAVSCRKIDPETMSTTDENVPAEITAEGQKLTVSLGDISFPVEISYTVHIPAGTSLYLRNHAEVTYTQDGQKRQEGKDYIAQGSDFSAANGVKSVDKTLISTDPSDQWVTYTIRFWNDQGFLPGEIRIDDDLDDHVRYLFTTENEYFTVTPDEADPTLLHITNTKEIKEGIEAEVVFVCDFTDVPEGYTVLNTVGGNTTHTTKVGGSVVLTAKKMTDGAAPGEKRFTFRLYDSDHKLLQTQTNDAEGSVTFAKISYSKEDLGRTYTYTIEEVIPNDREYDYDHRIYTAEVKVAEEADENGKIDTEVTITCDGEETDTVLFENNTPEKIDIQGTKTWDDNDDQDGKRPAKITFILWADGRKEDSVTVTAEDDWSYSFTGLFKYDIDGHEIVYTVTEEKVPGYETAAEGYDFTNMHVPEKISIPVKKVWKDGNDKEKLRPEEITVLLLADGEETGLSLVLNKENGWKGSFEDLDVYKAGKKIVYTLAEVTVDGYKVKITGNSAGFTVTNTHKVPPGKDTPPSSPPSPPTVPNTGDPSALPQYFLFVLLCILGLYKTEKLRRKYL